MNGCGLECGNACVGAGKRCSKLPRERRNMEQLLRDVSVIICTYTLERWEAVCAAIGSIYAQSVQPREVIVVVDHNPELMVHLSERWPQAVVVENHDARGLSGARNTGIALAQGAYLAFLDDDAVAEPNWLE